MERLEVSIFAAAFACAAWFAPMRAAAADYDAGVIYEKARTTFDIHRDGSFVKTWEGQRLIETEQGGAKEGSFSIPFKAGYDTVRVIDAHVVTADGRTLVVAPDAMFVQEPQAAPETATYSDMRMETVVFPDARPGSRLFLRYELTRTRPDFDGVFSDTEWFSIHAKRLDYSYRFRAPRDMGLRVEAQGMKLEHEVQGDDEMWIASGGVPSPVAPESGGPLAIDYSPHLAASNLPDYAAFARFYAKLTAGSSEVSPAVAALAEQLTRGIDGEREQAHVLYDWVSANIRYVGVQIGSGSWVPRPAAEVLAHRYGDCKDHVALLSALLQAKGIRNTGALVNAGPTWWLPAMPVPQAFDHIITYLPSLDLFLDSTARTVGFGFLPTLDADKRVLLVDSGEMRTTPRARAQDGRSVVTQTLAVGSDGLLAGSSHSRTEGWAAATARALFGVLQAVPDEQIVAALLQQDGEAGTGSLVRPRIDSLDDPVETTIAFSLTDRPVPADGGTLPLARGVLFGGAKSFARGLTDAPRHLPFLCVPVDYHEQTTIALPPGRHLGPLPAQTHVADPDPALNARFDSSFSLQDTSLVITRDFVIDPPHAVCDASSYAHLQALAKAMRRDYEADVSLSP